MTVEEFATHLSTVITSNSPPPGRIMVITTGLLALLLSLPTTRVGHGNPLGTLVHETGHAAIGALVGSVEQIQLTSAQTGVTYTRSSDGVPAVLVSAAGYASPPLAGLGIAAAVTSGHAPQMLAAACAVCLAVLMVARDLRTILTSLLVGILMFALLFYGAPALHTGSATLLGWVLLLYGLLDVWPLVHNRLHGATSGHDDAASLADTTRIPAFVWIAAWTTLSLWCLHTSTTLLVLT